MLTTSRLLNLFALPVELCDRLAGLLQLNAHWYSWPQFSSNNWSEFVNHGWRRDISDDINFKNLLMDIAEAVRSDMDGKPVSDDAAILTGNLVIFR
uniref:Uncharacterized protein n=1 Tax=Romanomermis culicivorax TaxID=13658 RepID=A0A915KGC8_ROMCU